MDKDAQTVQLIREIISALGSIQNTSHGYINSGKKSCLPEMHSIKSDADTARGKVRDLAIQLGVEY